MASSAETRAKLNAPEFDDLFRDRLSDLFLWRRDVRRFRRDPIRSAVIAALLEQASLAPSVGNSQPWRFVLVEESGRRDAVANIFTHCNADALASYEGERAEAYAQLKLEGLRDAPVHLAVFCDDGVMDGHGLGRRTMPETLRYSVVMAIHTLWLAARARGLGIGWVSILDPTRMNAVLDIPAGWSFVSYLCIGHPIEEHCDPELVRHGWQERHPFDAFVFRR